MSGRIVKGSPELGAKIKSRRNDFGYTIEEAAAKAGVGTKTWSRYEAGESIRRDKVMSICRVLNWRMLPDQEEGESEFDIQEYQRNEAWPQELADMLGDTAAVSFVIGSEVLLDNIQQELDSLSSRPRGTHIGELEVSWLNGSLPPQFLTHYDYEFVYYLRSVLMRYRSQASSPGSFVAHTVMEELVLYLVMEESRLLMESIVPQMHPEEDPEYSDWDNWPFDLFDDMDLVTFLYSDWYLEEGHPYHFTRWREEQFYCAT